MFQRTPKADPPNGKSEPEAIDADLPPLTQEAVQRLYRRPAAFTDLLPWVEYHPASRTFLLEDGISMGALFELTPAGTEARTPAFMALAQVVQSPARDHRG